jgi:hypothetical protein
MEPQCGRSLSGSEVDRMLRNAFQVRSAQHYDTWNIGIVVVVIITITITATTIVSSSSSRCHPPAVQNVSIAITDPKCFTST